MSEKSRRNHDREIRLSQTQMKQPGMDEMPGAERERGAAESASLAEEYRYVVADLKRIAVIAAGMLVVLVVLALLLP